MAHQTCFCGTLPSLEMIAQADGDRLQVHSPHSSSRHQSLNCERVAIVRMNQTTRSWGGEVTCASSVEPPTKIQRW
jgi:hypothetical protein